MADLFRRPASIPPVTTNVSVFQVASKVNPKNFGESSGVNMLPKILTADDAPPECKSPLVQSTEKRLNPSAVADRSVGRPRPSRNLLLDDALTLQPFQFVQAIQKLRRHEGHWQVELLFAVPQPNHTVEMLMGKIGGMDAGDKRFVRLSRDFSPQVDKVGGASRIQRGHWPVDNNHLSVLHEKPCDGVPLLLASRQPRRPFADSSTMPTCSSAPTANVWFLGDTRDIRDWKNAPLPQTTGQNVVQDAEMGNEIILLVNDSDKAR